MADSRKTQELTEVSNICIRNPWSGIMQTIWGDPDRYVQTYYARYNKNPRAQIGVTGRSSVGMGPFKRPTVTTASSAASTM